jgi:hypothetical protein
VSETEATRHSTTFADLETGDVFSFAKYMSPESWEKTGAHQARVVNSDYTRNVAGAEPVNVLFAIADRRARLRDEEQVQ